MAMRKLSHECLDCILQKQLGRFPADASEDEKLAYDRAVLRILADAGDEASPPVLIAQIEEMRAKLFGASDDFAETKAHFNRLMLSLLPGLRERTERSEDPFLTAMKLALSANYIDFAAMDRVDEAKLRASLAASDEIALPEGTVSTLRRELEGAEKVVYLTDNCGEIAADRLFIETLLGRFPQLAVTVIVRGRPTINDATLTDAHETGLDTLVPVLGNGSAVAGTDLGQLPPDARCAFEEADVIFAKGQGNFETLYGCGANLYYLFLCKCRHFADRFGVPGFTGMLVRERDGFQFN